MSLVSILECLALLLAVVASLDPPTRTNLVRQILRVSGRLARHHRLSVVLVGLFALGITAGLSKFLIRPAPMYHDEFSYLLAADTFARGRLTNPEHPMSVHFETFNVIHHPTYASKYPPAQGGFLAVGQVLGGDPLFGVWLSVGLAGAAICWMLQGWLPARWALLGGVLAVLRLSLQGRFADQIGYWSQSYWGGAVAALGGAMVFGALPRLMARPRISTSLVLALGLAILANSRPFEGLLVSLPAWIWLVWWIFNNRNSPILESLARIVAPVTIVVGLATGLMAYYNYRVTGDAFRMPYQVHEETYGSSPPLLWQQLLPEKSYNHDVIRSFHQAWARTSYFSKQSFTGLLSSKSQELRCLLICFYLGIALSVPLAMLPWAVRKRGVPFALITTALFIATFLQETWGFPHYAAPITSLLFLLVIQGIRHCGVCYWWERARLKRRFLVRAIPAICVASSLILLLQLILRPADRNPGWHRHRAALLAKLEETPGQHLVLVRYGPNHDLLQEWVYNSASIDDSKVVWAREMDSTQNRHLFAYFQNREIWLLSADDNPPSIVPYDKVDSTKLDSPKVSSHSKTNDSVTSDY